MENSLSHQIERLLNQVRKLRLQAEQAEAYAAPLCQLTAELSHSGLLKEATVLGDFLLTRSYTDDPFSDSAQLLQAALIVPAGIGIIYWDVVEFENHRSSRTEILREAVNHFVPFHELPSAMRGLLLPQIRRLFDGLGQHLQLFGDDSLPSN
ncbi:hypothetical protein Pla110_13730 [Polystyrenella longa]|uniref:Uncharacterized protein n=1 Tax=Polystyrenella longa TaxID=2528007 RepID=A0A518CKB4_9PLAN|nr:hypothetical protein [Polystyrenella longa]QDU79662.1 hypothetical protein Pla110_13730 [Polystyrenella longa]